MDNKVTISKRPEEAGNCLFTYAVISDTHLNEDEDHCNSPFEVNKRANRRLRYVIDDLNKRDLALVFHLGDVVHPVPSMDPLYAQSASCFHQQTSFLKHPLHIIPGNHDVGDKYIPWGPAGTVNNSFLEAWTEHFGDHYFHITYDEIIFIGINAQLIGSGLPMEQQQKLWLEDLLRESSNKRIYLFTHYPPYLAEVDEPEHYDNLSKQGRGWLLHLIEKYNIEAMFAGHVHHFWYNQYANCQCYLLPSTAFTRQDYAEMFRVGPAAEFGRNDKDKLGYLLVHVHERGHFIEMVRCYGNEITENQLESKQKLKSLKTVNPVTNKAPILGFDLRQDWAEFVQIPPSGGLDEFDRKWVRNDYPLLALMEMGVKKLRIPFADILNPKRRNRLHEMTKLGFEFTLFSFGIPEETYDGSVIDNISKIITAWEISWPVDKIDELHASIKNLPLTINCQFIFSALRSKSDILESGRTYYHVINHGYTESDTNLSKQLSVLTEKKFSGYVLRCGYEDSVLETMKLASEINKKTNLQSSVHLRITADNPAENLNDESFICKRITEAIIYGWFYKIDNIYCDTLATNDRGYFPREGVLDRLYNPKKGFYLVKHFHALLNSLNKKDISSDSYFLNENNGNTVLHIKMIKSDLIIIFTKSEDWLKKQIGKLLTETQKSLQRLNWVSGELETINSSSSSSVVIETNKVDNLHIEIILNDVINL